MNYPHDQLTIKNIPAYSIKDTAQYLRIPLKNVRAWTTAIDYDTKKGSLFLDPFIDIPSSQQGLLSFINIVEAHILQAIQGVHKIQPFQLWNSINYIKDKLEIIYPLANQRFATKGIDLFVQHYGELIQADNDLCDRLILVINTYFQRVEFDDYELPSKLYPITHPTAHSSPKAVSIDPLVAFGRLVINGTGITTSIIKERYSAGESIEDLAIDYNRDRLCIEEAIRCELYGYR